MKKIVLGRIIYSFALFFYLLFPLAVQADVINPNYFKAKCNPGEIEVECSWSRPTLNAPIADECLKYSGNPNYRYLEGTGSTFGGRQKYCFKPVSTSAFATYHARSFLPLLVITILIEFPIFIIFGFRSKKFIYSAVIVNLISSSVFYLSALILPLKGVTILFLEETLIIVFEAVLLKVLLKDISLKKIFSITLVANIISAIFGGMVISYIFNH